MEDNENLMTLHNIHLPHIEELRELESMADNKFFLNSLMVMMKELRNGHRALLENADKEDALAEELVRLLATVPQQQQPSEGGRDVNSLLTAMKDLRNEKRALVVNAEKEGALAEDLVKRVELQVEQLAARLTP